MPSTSKAQCFDNIGYKTYWPVATDKKGLRDTTTKASSRQKEQMVLASIAWTSPHMYTFSNQTSYRSLSGKFDQNSKASYNFLKSVAAQCQDKENKKIIHNGLFRRGQYFTEGFCGLNIVKTVGFLHVTRICI